MTAGLVSKLFAMRSTFRIADDTALTHRYSRANGPYHVKKNAAHPNTVSPPSPVYPRLGFFSAYCSEPVQHVLVTCFFFTPPNHLPR